MGARNSKPSLSTLLQKESETLIPPADLVERANVVKDRIEYVLFEGKRTSDEIFRIVIGRINVKKKFIPSRYPHPDIEIVIFFNYLNRPPYNNTVNMIAGKLRESTTKQIVRDVSGSHVRIKMDGILFDVFAVPNNRGWYSGQLENTIRQIENFKEKRMAVRCLRPGLCENWNSFLEQQSAFALGFMRLACEWDRRVEVAHFFIESRKLIIEILSLHAVKMTRGKKWKRALKIFLKLFLDFNAIKVDIMQEDFEKSKVPPEIFKTRPRILDPLIPFINLADNVPMGARNVYKAAAERTFEKMAEFKAASVEDIWKHAFDEIV